jgi:hypothetical protein
VAAAAYAGGPGDVFSTNALAWGGLRAYNSAYATGSNPALDLHDNSSGTLVATINILSSGALDVATAATVIAGGASKVGKLYDQTGNGNHFTQGTNANRPTLTLNAIGSLPGLTFSSSSMSVAANLISFVAGHSLAVVAKRTGANTSYGIVMSGADNPFMGFKDATNTAVFNPTGGQITATATDGSFHSIIGTNDGTTGTNLYVNGSATSSAISSGVGSGLYIGNRSSLDVAFTGVAMEFGAWNAGMSAGNASSISSQQHTYWGF